VAVNCALEAAVLVSTWAGELDEPLAWTCCLFYSLGEVG
jgi:hypothetical protein